MLIEWTNAWFSLAATTVVDWIQSIWWKIRRKFSASHHQKAGGIFYFFFFFTKKKKRFGAGRNIVANPRYFSSQLGFTFLYIFSFSLFFYISLLPFPYFQAFFFYFDLEFFNLLPPKWTPPKLTDTFHSFFMRHFFVFDLEFLNIPRQNWPPLN